jgi:hypothetical protein
MKKNFDDKLIAQFTNLKVGVPDYPKHFEHLYCDYIELVALFSNMDFVTKSDILDRLKDEGENNIVDIVNTEIEDENHVLESEEISEAQKNDIKEKWIDNLFLILEERATLYGNDYPFNFSFNKIILKQTLSNKNELYIYLLISSNLDLFKKVRSELTTDFETVSYFSLKNYLPEHAIVKQFGKNSEYSGNAIKKIRDLAYDLKVEIREHEIENISERNNQERGLDVIGWIPFSDSCPNIITILGQCACGKDWPSKHHDTKRYKHYLKFYRLDPYHAIFIPYALIGKGGNKFFRSDDIEDNTLVFERKRIIELFTDFPEFSVLRSKQVVEKCIEYSEDIL